MASSSLTQISTIAPDPRQIRPKFVPLDLEYSILGKSVAHAHIDLLQSRKEPYAKSSDEVAVVVIPRPAQFLTVKEMQSHLVHRPNPNHPDEVRAKYINGTVLLHAIIGTDGKITSISLIGSPDDTLTASAMKAVSLWKYHPYLGNNVPIEVETTITVTYTFSP